MASLTGLGSCLRWLGLSSGACSHSGRRVSRRSGEWQTQYRSTFQSSVCIMFAEVPLASHVANPRSKGRTYKRCFFMGEAAKYCGHFFPSMGSLFSTHFCEAEHCFPVAKWYSHRCPLSTLMHGTKHSWKEANRNHSSIRKLRTWKSPILGELYYRNQEFRGNIHPASHHFPSTQIFQFGENPFYAQKFSHLNIPKSLLLTTKPNFSGNATIFICQRKAILSDTLTTFSSQSVGICQNVLYLINMYNASSHILCQERVSMLQLISLICIQDYT